MTERASAGDRAGGARRRAIDGVGKFLLPRQDAVSETG
jgi:hypothetical protein